MPPDTHPSETLPREDLKNSLYSELNSHFSKQLKLAALPESAAQALLELVNKNDISAIDILASLTTESRKEGEKDNG